jgi:hypothetical protein
VTNDQFDNDDDEARYAARPMAQCGEETCTSDEVYERQSFGIYAGKWCDKHWKSSGYKDEPASAFDPAYAGETYGDEDL